ncbi:MAG: hypothetical protein LUG44_08235 [Clostridiales bacterium]|nr:hypothetical protein [Clostridiales bacterium]
MRDKSFIPLCIILNVFRPFRQAETAKSQQISKHSQKSANSPKHACHKSPKLFDSPYDCPSGHENPLRLKAIGAAYAGWSVVVFRRCGGPAVGRKKAPRRGVFPTRRTAAALFQLRHNFPLVKWVKSAYNNDKCDAV